MAIAARTATEADLRRLGAFAEELYVRCEFAKIDAEPPEEFDWRPAQRRLSEMVAKILRELIEAGRLLDATKHLVHPGWGCCCGLRFLTVASEFLEPSDVQRLEALAHSQEARDESTRVIAEIMLALEREKG